MKRESKQETVIHRSSSYLAKLHRGISHNQAKERSNPILSGTNTTLELIIKNL